MNETTEIDMIIIMHRLKRLIRSSYHQKQIDIIITDNAYQAQLFIFASKFLQRCNTVA